MLCPFFFLKLNLKINKNLKFLWAAILVGNMIVACCVFECADWHGKPGTKFYWFPNDPELNGSL